MVGVMKMILSVFIIELMRTHERSHSNTNRNRTTKPKFNTRRTFPCKPIDIFNGHTSLRVRVLEARVNEGREVDVARRVMVAEARRNLEKQVIATDVELDDIYGRIDARQTRILNLTARIARLRGETNGN